MPMTQQEYIARKANHCPNCGSTDISDGDYHWENTSPVNFVIDQLCSACFAEWQVVTRVVEYRNLYTEN